MKKTLLLMAAAAMCSTAAMADVITLDVNKATNIVGTENNGNYQPLTSLEIDGYKFEFGDNSASTKPALYVSSKYNNTIRLYNKCYMTVTAPAAVNGLDFVTRGADGFKGIDASNMPTANAGTLSVGEYTLIWSADPAAANVTITMPSGKGADGKNGNIQIESIKVYTGTDKPGEGGGGDVHPTPEVYETSTVAQLLAVPNGSNFTFEGELTVAYANGPDCYVYDTTGATLLYSDKADPWVEVLAPGTVLTEFAGNRNDYNSTVEFIPTMINLLSDGTVDVVAHTCTTAADVNALPIDTYVELVNVSFSISTEDDRNATAVFADGTTMTVHNRFCGNSYDPKTYFPETTVQQNVYGLRSSYKDAVQVTFVKAEAYSEDGINAIEADAASTGIYNLMGIYMGTEKANLPAGIYVVNGKKLVIK